jgi:hypothetical protein
MVLSFYGRDENINRTVEFAEKILKIFVVYLTLSAYNH